jgi:Tfp pilus assembly protein PilF
MDSDLHLGQIAIRMGSIQPHQLPGLLREARVGHVEESAGRASSLGQVLLRRKLISVSDYLYMARQVRVERDDDSESESDVGQRKDPSFDLQELQQAFTRFESGELDHSSFEDMLGKSAEISPLARPAQLTRFGKYELLGEVARGGMGIVYRARDDAGRVVALKVMLEADDDEIRLKRFEHEAELAAALDHPHIVSIHDAGRIDGIPYFTMDLIEGKTLDDLFEGEGIDRDVAFKAIAEVAHAIDHAHERGIVHRDLKPGNIILDDQKGTAHVTDFGLARDLARMTRLTQVGQAVGTPYYMAPEQVRGERDVDGRADIYALGVILYEVLTGDVPFDADSPLSLFKKIDQEPVVLELEPELGIDEHVHKIVMRALAKDRQDRYARGRLLADDLERYLRGVPPKARAHHWGEDVAERLRRNRMSVLAAALGVLALITVGVASLMAWHRYQHGLASGEGRNAADVALDAARSAAASAESALDAGHPHDTIEAAKRGLERLDSLDVLLTEAGPRGDGAREVFAEDPGDRARLQVALAQALASLAQEDPATYTEDARQALLRAAQDAPRALSIPLLLAELLERSGESAAAVEALGAALAIDGRSAVALTQRGELLLTLGRHEDALRDLADALLVDDRNVEARIARARTYVALGKLDAALEDADVALGLAPEQPEPHLARGDVARARGRPREARSAYERATHLAKESPRPHERLGELALERGSYQQALEAYQNAERAGGGPAALLGQARAMARLFRLEEARVTCDAALAASRGGPTLRATDQGAALTLRGEVALANGGLAEAKDDFTAAVAADPQSVAPRVWLVRLLLREPELDAAAARDLLAPAEDDGADLLTARARLALAEGDAERARAYAEQAITVAGTRPHAPARAALAAARIALTAGSQAIQAATDAAWAEGSGQGDLASAYLQRGSELLGLALAYREEKLRHQASQLLQASLRLDPHRARSHAALARLRLAEQESELAWASCNQAAALAPHRPELSELLAEAALLDPTPERLEQALAGLERGVEAGGATARRRLLRSKCLSQLGRWSDARQELEHALRSEPSIALEGAYAGVLERLGLQAEAARARERAERLRREHVEKVARLEAWSAAGSAPSGALQSGLEEALADADLQRDLRLREALFKTPPLFGSPREALAGLSQLLTAPGQDALDRADQALAPRWIRLGDAEREGLLRAAGTGAPARTLSVAVAALLEGLAGRHEEGWDAQALAQAEQAVSSRPASLAAWAARAYLRVHLGEADRALRELDAAILAAPRSGLLRYIRAEALADLGQTEPRDEALTRARSAGVHDLEARIGLSPLLR